MKKLIAFTSFVSVFAPALAFAQTINNADDLFGRISSLLNKVIPIIIALAVVMFIWGVLKYVTSGDAEDKSAARNYMIYGIIAIFVMVSVWGLVNLLAETFSLNKGPVQFPQVFQNGQ